MLNLPGEHNVLNALAAIAVGRELSIPFPTIARALKDFTGVIRRFETKGERGGVLVLDDYAHHPTEITATLAAARQVHPGRRLVALFQPHLYSRTRDFAVEFGRSLAGCDLAIVTDIYPSREKPLPGVTGDLVAQAARSAGQANVIYISDKTRVAGELENVDLLAHVEHVRSAVSTHRRRVQHGHLYTGGKPELRRGPRRHRRRVPERGRRRRHLGERGRRHDEFRRH